MKIFILIFNLIFISGIITGQGIVMDVADPVDIGKSIRYTATVTGPSDYKVVSYKWTTLENEDGNSGPSGIIGMTNGGTQDPVTKTTTSRTNAINVVYSDVDENCSCADLKLEVTLKRTVNDVDQFETIAHNHSGKAKCIKQPQIAGPSEVGECCDSELVFGETQNRKHNYTYKWTVTGGTIVGSDTDPSARVLPSLIDNVVVTLEIGILDGDSRYKRTATHVVTRTPIETPIKGPNYVCDFNTYLYCIDDFCGLSNVTWQVPPGFEILASVADINGEGPIPRCISVRAGAAVPSGFVGQISVQAEVKGGCHIDPEYVDVTRYTSEAPPAPDGYPVLVFEDGYDPCEPDDYYVVVWRGEEYENGVTTIGPGVIIDVPHHDNGQVVEVEVCNLNLCSGLKSCSTYRLELPFPCEHGGGHDDPEYRKTQDAISLGSNHVGVYPVPTTDIINIEGDLNVGENCMLMNLSGKLMMNTRIQNDKNHSFSFKKGISPGLYYLRVPLQNGSMIIKKVVITE